MPILKQKRKETSHTRILTSHLKTLEPEASTPKRNRRQEIIKLKTEVDKIETKKIVQRMNETKIWAFEKTNKINKPLSKLTKREREDPN